MRGIEEEPIGEQRTTRQIEITQSASEDDRLDLLKELAKIGKSNTSSSQVSDPRTFYLFTNPEQTKTLEKRCV